MGYFKDNTVEIEIDGKTQRVFSLEAKKLEAALTKKGHKVVIKGKEPK